jgi:hypothetical protein
MGVLKPGATYIYERNGPVVYAREFGADPSTRQVAGWDYDPANRNWDPRIGTGRPLIDQLKEDQLWADLRRAAQKNVALRDAIDRAVEIYHLSKDDNG